MMMTIALVFKTLIIIIIMMMMMMTIVVMGKIKTIKIKKKNYTTIIRTYWATKYKSRRENKFGRLATIFQICSMDADILS